MLADPNATGGHGHASAVGVGYRNDTTTGIAKGDEPETLYMVASIAWTRVPCL